MKQRVNIVTTESGAEMVFTAHRDNGVDVTISAHSDSDPVVTEKVVNLTTDAFEQRLERAGKAADSATINSRESRMNKSTTATNTADHEGNA